MAIQPNGKAESRVTGLCLASYPSLFTPRAKVAKPGETARDPKFEIALVAIPAHGSAEWLRPFKADALALLMRQHNCDAKMIEAKIAAGEIHWPFKGVTDQVGYPAGGVILNAKSTYKPQVVSRFIDPATGKLAVLTDPDSVYPGALVRASITPYLFGYKFSVGKKGVTFNLNNVQLQDDQPKAPRLDNKRAADEDFDGVDPVVGDLPATPTAGDAPSAASNLLD